MIAPVVLIARKCQKCRKYGNRDQKLKFDRRDAVRPGTVARACPVTNERHYENEIEAKAPFSAPVRTVE